MQREEDEKLFLALRAGTISIVRAAASNLYHHLAARVLPDRSRWSSRVYTNKAACNIIVPVGKDHACTWEKPGFSHDIFGVLHIMSLYGHIGIKNIIITGENAVMISKHVL